MAQPHKIFNLISPSVFIDMMDKEHAKVFCPTMSTNSGDSASLHDVAICVLAMLPAGVSLANNNMLIFPDSQAGFITKEIFTFGVLEILRGAIERFPARGARNIGPFLLRLELTCLRAEFPPSYLQMPRLCIKFF